MKEVFEVMADLETLGKRPGCKILSIGAVVFNQAGLHREFYVEAKINHQGDLVADQSTIDWWNKQDPAARDRLYNNQDLKPTLRQALEQFNGWLRELGGVDERGHIPVNLWGNGADFDNAILQVAYDRVSIEDPAWQFWNNRCYRTLKGLAPSVQMVRQGTYHNALDDAKSQAEHAVRIMKHLGLW